MAMTTPTMRERLIAAVKGNLGVEEDPSEPLRGYVSGSVWPADLVDAILAELREPDEAILSAMRDTVPVDGHEWEFVERDAVPHWTAMIDAIRGERT